MNTKFFAAAALALALVPAAANAASFSYDPSVDSGTSPFIAQPTQVNPANAAAAAADAQRYQGVAGNAVIGTHGASAQPVVEYDPGAADGQSAFQTKLILSDAGVAPVVHAPSIPYADNGELIGN